MIVHRALTEKLCRQIKVITANLLAQRQAYIFHEADDYGVFVVELANLAAMLGPVVFDPSSTRRLQSKLGFRNRDK